MRIIQIANQTKKFKIFQVCANFAQPDFSIYKKAQTDKPIRWENLTEVDIKNLRSKAIEFLKANQKSIYCQVLLEFFYDVATPVQIQSLKNSNQQPNIQDLQRKAHEWLTQVFSIFTSDLKDPVPFEKEMIKIQIVNVPITPENEIIFNLISKPLKEMKTIIDSLSDGSQRLLKPMLNNNFPSLKLSIMSEEINKIQQQILSNSSGNRTESSSNFDVKTLTGWFLQQASQDTNYVPVFYDDIKKSADVYAKNRLSAVSDETVIKNMISKVVPALNLVLKVAHEFGIEKTLPQDVVRSKLLTPIKALDEVWPHWKSDIGRIHTPGKGPLGLLKELYGQESEQSGWLSKQQYMEIKLKFNEKVTNLIQQSAQKVCNPKQITCNGFMSVLKNLNTPGFLSDTGAIADCFRPKNSTDPMFSPGSIESAKNIVKKCTSFRPDVKINDTVIDQIINTLLSKCVEWGNYKGNKVVKTQKSATQPTQPTQPAQPAQSNQPTQPKQPEQPNQLETIGRDWENPETILFASQILLILTQFSYQRNN